jgi:putative glutathione S-transferase
MVISGYYRLIGGRSNPRTHAQLIVLNIFGLNNTVGIELTEGWEKEPELTEIASGKKFDIERFKPDLYPEDLREEIDALNLVIFNEIDKAALDAGFAKTQGEYEKAYERFFGRVDDLEKRLGGSRYLFPGKLTASDVHLFASLARFDEVYDTVLKCNRNRLIDLPNLWNYAKDLYQRPEFKSATDFKTIRRDYQLFPPERNPYGLLSPGPELRTWDEHHDRAKLEVQNGKR